MFFIVFLLFLFISCRASNYQKVQSSEELKVVDYYPRGESVPVFVQYIMATFSSQVTFRFEIEPPITGELMYDSQAARIIFKPFFSLDYNRIYRVRLEARDIFSGSSTEFSWEFKTLPEDLVQYNVFVPKCFKDSILVEVSFPYMSSVYIYSNSVRVKETIASGGKFGFEISENLKEGQNIIEVEIIPLSSGEKISFRYYSIKDTKPPEIPILRKISETEFAVETPYDECGVTNSYLLFLSDNFVGFVPNEFDTHNIAFEGGEICVRAVDTVGNISDCSEKFPQGFSSHIFQIPGNNPVPKWGKIFFLKDGLFSFSDGTTIFTTSITCTKIFPNLTRILCQQGEKILLIDRNMVSQAIYNSYVSDTCPLSDAFSDGNSIVLPDRIVPVKAVRLLCLDNLLLSYDKKSFQTDYWTKEITSLVYLGKEIVDDSSEVSDIFPYGTSFGVFFQNVDLAQLIYRLTGVFQDLGGKKISLLSLLSSAGDVLYVKEYNNIPQVIKVLAFKSVFMFLTEHNSLIADFRAFSGGETTRYIYSGVLDIGLSDINDDAKADLFIFFEDGTLKVFTE